jgi:hypothetical protein
MTRNMNGPIILWLNLVPLKMGGGGNKPKSTVYKPVQTHTPSLCFVYVHFLICNFQKKSTCQKKVNLPKKSQLAKKKSTS